MFSGRTSFTTCLTFFDAPTISRFHGAIGTASAASRVAGRLRIDARIDARTGAHV
jgi:hypothetical protein